MIIPSIDMMGGQAVQLIGGRELAIEAGDPTAIAERFGLVGELAVIDLDAALGQGNNRQLIERLCRVARCRVGGGIRDLASARRWLDAGAEKIILGTAARADLLKQLPKERVIAALDAVNGEVVVEGWRTHTGERIEDRMSELRDLVSGFLVTFVEREGRLEGTAIDRVNSLRHAAGDARLTIAGGVSTAEEVAALDRLGADAQVGMALYTGRLQLADALAATLKSDREDGLWPTVVVDPHGRALGQCWSNAESLRCALEKRRGVYYSRKRGLWEKGKQSGATQRLLRVDIDCDRDTLRFVVGQAGPGFCHQATTSCWGPLEGLPALAQRLLSRVENAPAGSYTKRLLGDPSLLKAKLLEEAAELAEANEADAVAWEAADVIYFAMVAMARAGVSLADVERELDRRSRAVNRRDNQNDAEDAA